MQSVHPAENLGEESPFLEEDSRTAGGDAQPGRQEGINAKQRSLIKLIMCVGAAVAIVVITIVIVSAGQTKRAQASVNSAKKPPAPVLLHDAVMLKPALTRKQPPVTPPRAPQPPSGGGDLLGGALCELHTAWHFAAEHQPAALGSFRTSPVFVEHKEKLAPLVRCLESESSRADHAAHCQDQLVSVIGFLGELLPAIKKFKAELRSDGGELINNTCGKTGLPPL
eukprot:TRINITY_DN24190_c0_g1_i2.p1 TRINITY_DN24190_c0_g1~~TRINITY_DN24190_c0_g1_i2.p1  ORF type:complete len:225 (+),score=41.79 TRINITY_DN24190_c0_g1_i2:156-830(+)